MAGENPKCTEKKTVALPRRAHYTNWSGNPGLRGERLASNRPSHGTAQKEYIRLIYTQKACLHPTENTLRLHNIEKGCKIIAYTGRHLL
jgi:hypothetical protein